MYVLLFAIRVLQAAVGESSAKSDCVGTTDQFASLKSVVGLGLFEEAFDSQGGKTTSAPQLWFDCVYTKAAAAGGIHLVHSGFLLLSCTHICDVSATKIACFLWLNQCLKDVLQARAQNRLAGILIGSCRQ